jgi:acyl-CoA thioesterase II
MDAAEFLGITRTSETTWQLRVTERLITPGNFLFGGCGLAGAVVAMEGHGGRPTIWATAQYLSYAPKGSDVVFTSTLAAVGGHVTQARAVATIDGREILTVNAALGAGELSAERSWVTMPTVPPPADCPRRSFPREMGETIFEHVETRYALGRRFEDLDGTPGDPHSALWARVPGHLDPSAATLAIFGDFVSGAAAQPMGLRLMGRSLDNTVRVAALESTEWVLIDVHVHALEHGISQGIGYLFSERGTLLATASQSNHVFVWRDQG